MATIVHFNISADDMERAKKFYEDLFAWKIEAMSGNPGYYEIKTAELCGEPGLSGGLIKREGLQQAGITNFIGVSSIDETLGKLYTLGGKIIHPKQPVPGYGFFAVCADTENNVFGLFERPAPYPKNDFYGEKKEENISTGAIA